MNVELDPRAEVALRSLSLSEQVDILHLLERVERAGADNWKQIVGAHLLGALRGENLYVVQAGADLRLLTKTTAGSMIVQDIFPKERLERMPRKALA